MLVRRFFRWAWRRSLLAFLMVGCAVWLATSSPTAQSNRFGAIRSIAANKPQLSRDEAQAIGRELSQVNLATILAGIPIPQAATEQLANDLADLHMAWQQGFHRGLSEAQLAKSLNDHLELNGTPEYLQVKPYEVNRIRTEVWVKLPELSTGINRNEPRSQKPRQLFQGRMSPLEAFLVADWLLYQKWTDDAFVRTSAEDRAAKGAPARKQIYGLEIRPINPRRERFEAHIRSVGTKWQTVDRAVEVVNRILESQQ
jgi:hypothetical protein